MPRFMNFESKRRLDFSRAGPMQAQAKEEEEKGHLFEQSRQGYIPVHLKH